MTYKATVFKKIIASNTTIIILIILFLGIAFYFNFVSVVWRLGYIKVTGNEFSILANSFLEGRLDVDKHPVSWLDCSVFNGKCYWGQGPFPAILLLPFVAFFKLAGFSFYQGQLSFFLIVIIFYTCYLLAKKFGYSKNNSLWLAFAFCFASVFLGVALNQGSWYYSQVVATAFFLLALYENFNKKRYLLIGLCFAAVLATRPTASLGILFFILEIVFAQGLVLASRLKKITLLLLPVFIAGLLLLFYNHLRFGNFFSNGYSIALIDPEWQRAIRDRYGLFNFRYFLLNLYYYFFKTPDLVFNNQHVFIKPYFAANPRGLSFFIVSPIFLKIFWASIKNKTVLFSWLTSALILFIILLYFNTGYVSVGPRYIIDLLPLWFLILLFSFKGKSLGLWHKVLILMSGLVNFYFFLTVF